MMHGDGMPKGTKRHCFTYAAVGSVRNSPNINRIPRIFCIEHPLMQRELDEIIDV